VAVVRSGEGDQPVGGFEVIGSLGDAEQYARDRLAVDPAARYLVYDSAGRLLKQIPDVTA